ncbi:FitA-like ribbon-helix-helix domain-containing protein [Variovorax sp. DT-64]|uniref:FitA-like ribbon-helix-helix domain-containing protein n=1 Tax=Variovorax sp. DT-64 TaxID=3396160 RepID=UPI003F1B0EC7
MANLSVKDVPDDLAERLRQRAARNHRSLQGELMAILEQAIYEPAPAPVPRPGIVSIGWSGRPVLRRGGKPIEQIAAEHRVRFPEPIRSGPAAVDILRAERDAR